jgi:homoserine acetyltransferase
VTTVRRGWPIRDGVFDLGDFPAGRGGVIRDARLAWQTHGTLNDARDNVIIYPCSYSAFRVNHKRPRVAGPVTAG